MSPRVCSGDYVVLLTYCSRLIVPGMLLVFEHPLYGSLLKQVTRIDWQRQLFSAQGVNPSSVDSSQLSELPLACIKGWVLWQIATNR